MKYTKYKEIILEKDTRWDEIAYQYLGNCYNIDPLIEVNSHIPIGCYVPKDTKVIIPFIENNTKTNTILPPWK